MINFDDFKKIYSEATGTTLFDEEGELLDFYRNTNEIEMPVCGIWHVNPIPLTAVNKPFCGIATVDITVLSHPTKWTETRDTMNEFASTINGTSQQYTDKHGTTYSVSFNGQTCSVGNRILDAGIGYGEVVEIRQQLSCIIIESGVSAYDTFLYIDGLQIPFLSLVENKIHTTANIPSRTGVMQTLTEVEVYGIDFVIPYMKDDAGDIVRDVIDRSTGNEAHCVVLEIAGQKHCHIMQFTRASANVQPPQNIGMNVSMTELDYMAAKYNSMWDKQVVSGKFAAVDLTDRGSNAESFVIFWGDGCSEYYEKSDIPYHVYADSETSHDIIIFKKPIHYYLPLEKGVDYYGKTLYFRFNSSNQKIRVAELKDQIGAFDVLFGNQYDSTTPDKMADVFIGVDEYGKDRIFFRYGVSRYYIDKKGDDGEYYIYNGQKVQSLVDVVAYINGYSEMFIFTSVWD